MAETPALGLVLLDGRYERVHYGLAMAAAALAVGRPAVLFFTNGALLALAGAQGWRRLLPDAAGRDAAAQDAARRAAGVAGFEELLDACAQMGARFIACEMGLRTIGLAPDALRADTRVELAGLVTLLAALPDGAQPTVI